MSVLLVMILVVSSAAAVWAVASTAGVKSGQKQLAASPNGGTSGYIFEVTVLGTKNGAVLSPLSNANVYVTNTHHPSQSFRLNFSSSIGYYIYGAPTGSLSPGYYWVNASAPGYFTGTVQQPVRFSDTANINSQITLYKIRAAGTSVAVTVNGISGGLKGALVQFVEKGIVYSNAYGEGNQVIYSGYTNSTGGLSIAVNNTYNYTVIASINNSNSSYALNDQFYAPSFASLSSPTPSSVAITLPSAVAVQASIKTTSGTVPSGINGYMLEYAGTSSPVQTRLFSANVTSGFATFYAPAGNYVIAINATGQASYIRNITVPSAISYNLGTITLQSKFSSSAPLSSTVISYAQASPNWRYLNVTFNQVLDAGSAVNGLPFAYVPSARMQFALAFNGGYPEINATTVSAVLSNVTSLGPEYTTTYNLWSVNSSTYLGDAATFQLSMPGFTAGFVNSSSPLSIISSDSYSTLSGTLPANTSSYAGTFLAPFNSTEMHFISTIQLPPGFELSSNSTNVPSGDVVISGHTTVTVYTTVTGTGFATVSMRLESGQIPVVKAAAVTGKYSYAFMKNGTVQYFIIKSRTPINYTAQGSYDPSGGPLSYSWHWNSTNYSSSYTNASTTVVQHEYSINYTTPGVLMNITLTATTVTGQKASTTISVRIANDTTLSAVITPVKSVITSGRIYAGQDSALTVNGLKSKASISPGDNQGIIVSYNFTWGDGVKNYTVVSNTQSNLNASHSYSSAGNFTLGLNITDEAGFTSFTSVTVQVNKTLNPVVSFIVHNSKWASTAGSVQENSTVHFNASATTDPNFNNSVLLFEWNFGDAHNITNATTKGNVTYQRYVNLTGAQGGMNVTHIYTAISSTPLTVNLTVVDPAGNKASYTYALSVTSQPRPDLRVINITFSPKSFTQGSAGKITVYVINIGNANATSPKVTLYAIAAESGAKTKIGVITQFYNGTNSSAVSAVRENQTVHGSIRWTPSTFGNFTVKAVTSATYQLLSALDNTATQPVTVSQSQLQVYALYAGIVIIIVGVIAAIALRRRMPKRGYDKGKDQRKGK